VTPSEIQSLDRPALLPDISADRLSLGYVPLTDSAPLLVAQTLGLFTRHRVKVDLMRVGAWSALRDHIALGHLDGGQMLSPMPIAAMLGLSGLPTRLAAVATLARHGNTITFSEALIAEIAEAAPALASMRPLPATALAAALAARRKAGRPRPTLAVVFAFSSHNYLLRHWLASGGIDPEQDVHLVVVPPPLLPGELADGRIDGFCAGEPWGSRAVDLRLGRIALTTADIWPNHPEKLLTISTTRLARAPEEIEACIAAIIEAGVWLSDPANVAEAARIVHAQAMPDVPEQVVALALGRRLVLAPDESPTPVPGLQFHPAATCPHPEHGAWWARQMLRWGHIDTLPPDLIAEIWRPDIWQRAAVQAGVPAAIPASPPCPGDLA
jgi:NitT/TauT family transport system ATP-binding protein/nitrate/nitrite transport system substrate-binding protein